MYESVGNNIILGHKIRSRSFRFTPAIHSQEVSKKMRKCKRRKASASRQLFYVILDDIFTKLDHKTQCHKLKCFLDSLIVNLEKSAYVFPSCISYAAYSTSMRHRRVMKSVS